MATGSWLLAFTAGVAVSLAASWLLVSRLERLGERAGFGEAWLGLVAALAADAPEITAAVTRWPACRGRVEAACLLTVAAAVPPSAGLALAAAIRPVPPAPPIWRAWHVRQGARTGAGKCHRPLSKGPKSFTNQRKRVPVAGVLPLD